METELRNSLTKLILVILFLYSNANAQFILDTNFGNDGITRIDFGPGNIDTPNDLLLLDNDKIIAAGISINSFDYFIALSQLLPNGQPDSSGFGVNGKTLLHFVLRDQANAISIQHDEKIVVVGTQASSNAGSAIIPSIYRFNSNGSLDTTFADSGSLAIRFDAVSSGQFYSVKILPDKKILAVGNSTGNASGGAFGFGAMRFLPTGELDSQFGNGGKARINFGIDYNPIACAFSDTAIVMVTVAFISGINQIVLAMMDSSGNPNPVFGNNGIVQTNIEAISSGESLAISDDGKIILAGTTTNNSETKFSVFRFMPNGVIDSTFGTNGRTDIQFAPNDVSYDMKIDVNGKILLVGRASTGNGEAGLIRLNSDGSPDTTFAPDGKFTINLNNNSGTHYLTNCIPLLNGDILAAGFDFSSGGGDFMIVRLTQNPTGVEDDNLIQPGHFALSQNYPNPFNPSTKIEFSIPAESAVEISIYNILGEKIRELVNAQMSVGIHSINFDAGNLASGIYIYQIKARKILEDKIFTSAKKMILVK